MEEVELVKKLLPDEKKESFAESLLDDLSKTKTVSLKEAIEEISEQIKLRQSLHETMMGDIENVKSSINNMMPQSPTVESQKTVLELQKKIIEAEEMKVQEKLNCFRDIALLKKELREIIREFRDKENRASLLGDLLAE